MRLNSYFTQLHCFLVLFGRNGGREGTREEDVIRGRKGDTWLAPPPHDLTLLISELGWWPKLRLPLSLGELLCLSQKFPSVGRASVKAVLLILVSACNSSPDHGHPVLYSVGVPLPSKQPLWVVSYWLPG